MTNYKLIYFNARGRAETARLLFAQAGVKYEDERVDSEEWKKLKPFTPYGALPVLEVDGKQLAGSGPIARFLAEKFGLAGSDDFENADLASIADVVEDTLQRIIPVHYEKDETRKAGLQKELVETHFPRYFGTLEKRAASNKAPEGWIYGSKVTYADFLIFQLIGITAHIPNFSLDNYPTLAKLRSSVETLPNIAEWLKQRPQTEH